MRNWKKKSWGKYNFTFCYFRINGVEISKRGVVITPPKVKHKGYLVFSQHKFLSRCENINCGCGNITTHIFYYLIFLQKNQTTYFSSFLLFHLQLLPYTMATSFHPSYYFTYTMATRLNPREQLFDCLIVLLFVLGNDISTLVIDISTLI